MIHVDFMNSATNFKIRLSEYELINLAQYLNSLVKKLIKMKGKQIQNIKVLEHKYICEMIFVLTRL